MRNENRRRYYKRRQQRRIILLLVIAITIVSGLGLGIRFLINGNSEEERTPIAIFSNSTSLVSAEVITPSDIVSENFPIGKTPPPVVNGSGDIGRKIVALTFDDGPGYDSTDRILKTLKKHDIKATFFVLGTRVEQNPKMLKRIVDEGHEIGNHSYDHTDLSSVSNDKVLNQVKTTNDLVYEASGARVRLLRPPYGAYKEDTTSLTGMPVIMWNVDSEDWKFRNGPATVKHVKNTLYEQSIILFHDIYDSSADAVDELIPYLIDQGYEFVTVSEYNKIMGY